MHNMKKQQGFTLIETMVAMAIMGTFVAALLACLVTVTMATPITDERNTAHYLAEKQMEYIHALPYPVTATLPETDIPAGYVIGIDVTQPLSPEDAELSYDDNLQKITVTIDHQGKTVVTLESYRVAR